MTLDGRWGIGDGSAGAQAGRAGLVALAVAVLLMGAAAAVAPARAGTPNALPAGSGARVILYGDSLAWEAEASFRGALAADGFTVTTDTFGGTAMCDWLPQMRGDAAHVRPQAIVVEFSGNAITPCMRALDGAPLTGAAYYEAYAAAARSVLQTFAPDRTLVFFAGSPVTRQQVVTHSSINRQLNALYQRIAATSPDAGYVDAGAAVLADGQWTHTLPCLPEEPCTGTDQSGHPADVVRSPDGAHFCPVAPPPVKGVIEACPVWSSGAYRFGTAMAGPVAGAMLARVSGATTVLTGRVAGRQ